MDRFSIRSSSSSSSSPPWWISSSNLSMPCLILLFILPLLNQVQIGSCQKQITNTNTNNNERLDTNREPFLVKVTTSKSPPEKRGTLRLTTIPGQNSFPYRYVYPAGQPAYTQYATYTTPRSAGSSSSSGYSATSQPPIKVAYTLPTTMLLVMAAHPHSGHSPSGASLGGTFMLIPATTAAAHPTINYNIIPQARVPTVALIPAHYITKPTTNYANFVAAQQLLYKAPQESDHHYNSNHYRAPNHNYNPNTSSEENDSSESSTPNYGNRVRSNEEYNNKG